MDANFPALWGGKDRPVRPSRGVSEIYPEPAYVPPLGNNVVSATPPLSIDAARAVAERQKQEREGKARREGRALRYGLRRVSAWLSKRKNVTKCGRCRYLESSVGVAVKDGRAHFTGLVHCGSAWECPVCMHTIASKRADEVRAVVSRHRATGGGAYMLTLTLPHDAGDDLKPLRRHVTGAWSKVQAGAPYKRAKEKLGIVGTIRALEVTHGPNGWHPHLHVLILTAAPLEERATGELSELGKWYKRIVFRRWVKYVTQPNKETGKVYRAPTRENGVTFVPSHKDEYIAKLGLADELTRGSWKHAESGRAHRTPLQILQAIARAGLSAAGRDRALWVEYSDNMHRAKQLTWSRGLRDRYELGPEQEDLEIVQEAERAAVVVGFVASTLWDKRLKWNIRAQLAILAAAELGGAEGVLRELDRVEGLPDVPF